MFLHHIILLLGAVAITKGVSNTNFEAFVQYVEDYLEYTQNYELPTNNSYMYITEDTVGTVMGKSLFFLIIRYYG